MKKLITILLVSLLILFIIQQVNLTSMAVNNSLLVQKQAGIKSTFTNLSIETFALAFLFFIVIFS